MNDNRRIDWQWVFLVFWFIGSLGGVFYSFRFLVSAIFCFILAACAWPRDKKMSDGWNALQKIKEWEKGRGVRPPVDVFKTAAKWYMYNIDCVRREDLDTWKGAAIPASVKPHILSEKELKRQKGIIF